MAYFRIKQQFIKRNDTEVLTLDQCPFPFRIVRHVPSVGIIMAKNHNELVLKVKTNVSPTVASFQKFK